MQISNTNSKRKPRKNNIKFIHGHFAFWQNSSYISFVTTKSLLYFYKNSHKKGVILSDNTQPIVIIPSLLVKNPPR